jgi:ribose transport system substrate-binding protein
MKINYALALLALALVGCGSGDKADTTATTGSASSSSSSSKPLVAFSQANSADPWRQVFDADTKSAADQHAEHFTYEMQAAEDDPNKQINVINTFLIKKPKVLLVSPATEAVQAATDKAFDEGVPVILLDREVKGDKWTAYIGGDNREIGRQAGQFIVEKLGGKGTVLMIQGISDIKPTIDRREGAMESFKNAPGIKVIFGDDCKYQREAARNYMDSFLQKREPFDAVYAHNDEMAIGALMAYEAAANKPAKRPLFVGVDGCQEEVVQMIKEGKLDATFKYPGPGPKGIELAAQILEGKMPTEKRIILPTVKVTKENADQYLKDNPNLAK